MILRSLSRSGVAGLAFACLSLGSLGSPGSPDSPGTEIQIEGRALGPGGVPLAEAEVLLNPSLDPVQRERLADAGGLPKAVSRALTDAEGRFRLSAQGAGLFKVRVQAPGFVPLEFALEPLIEPVDLPDAELFPDTGLTVKVANKEGRPIPGARVRLASPDSRQARFQQSSWQAATRRAITDEKGTARLARGEKELAVLSASALGYLSQDRRNIRGTAAAFSLQPGLARPIRVQSADGTPAAGVLVLASELSHPLGFTDSKGMMPMAVPSKGSIAITLVAEDGRRVSGQVSAEPVPGAAVPEAAPGTDAGVSTQGKTPRAPRLFTLPDRLAFKGRVIDARSRAAIAGGLAWIPGELWGAAVTDNAGGFSLRGPAGQGVEILAGAPGYLRSDPASFTLSPELRSGPTLALKPAAAIEGIVVDEAGKPVAGAEAGLEVKQAPGRIMMVFGRQAPSARAVTSARGSFRLSPVDPEKTYDLKVSAAGYAPASREIIGLEPLRTLGGIRVELDRGQTVIGQTVDADRKPIRDAEAILRPSRADRQTPGGLTLGGMGAAERPFKGATDADGRFRITGLGSGTFDLELRRAGFARKTVQAIEVPKRAEPVDLGRLVLEPGVKVQGLVSAPDGTPVEGVEVSLVQTNPGPMLMMMPMRRPSSQAPIAVTGPEGRFLVEDLPRGEPISLSFSRTGYLDARESGIEVPQAEPLAITLKPASKVSGRVVGPDKKPIAGAQVSMTRSSGGGIGGEMFKMIMRDGAACDDEGHFVFDNVKPGQISLDAVASGWREAKIDGLDVPQGKDVEGVELPLKPGAIVTGRVLAPDGSAAIGARIGLVTDDPEPLKLGGVTTDGDGHYRLEGLAPGKIAVEATHESYVRTVKEIEARAGTNALNLQFEGGQDVAGLVRDSSGTPIAGAWIHLSAAGRGWGGPETRSGTDGTFKLVGVGDGDYSLLASREGFAPSTGDITVHVAGKPVLDLKVLLSAGGSIAGTIGGIDPEKLPQVSVRGFSAAGGDSATASVDRQGGYRLKDLSPGAWTVTASLPNSGQQTKGQVVLEPASADARLDLAFGEGLVLSGRALQGDSPVKGAVLFAQGTDVNHSAWGRTELDGAFRMEGLEPGTYRVELRQWETGLSYEETVELKSSREVVLRIPTAKVVGRIVDGADRRPLAGVAVSLSSAGEGEPRLRPSVRAATSDLNGRFEVANVSDGTWTLAAKKAGYAASTAEVTVQGGHDVSDVRVVLDPTEGLTLNVHLPSGRIPDTVEVAVLDAGGRTLTSGSFATGENGRVRVSSVPAGSWDLIVSAGGSAAMNLRVNVPGEPAAVALPPACSLRVKVPALAGASIAATATITGADGRLFRSLGWMTDATSQWRLAGGQLELDTLPPGSWTVQVAASDGRTWSGTSATSAGTTSEVVLQ